MYKLLIATTAAVALATVGTASAADLPVKAPPMVAPPVVYNWTGCYISGGVGYGMWNQDHFIQARGVQITAEETAGGRGWLGRVGGGCDYQVAPQFVIGAFGDFDFMNLKTHTFANTALIFGAEEKESAAWHAGARVGYLPYPDLMTFVSGGWTQARFDRMDFVLLSNPTIPIGLFIDRHTYSGGFIGGGTEWRVPWTSFHGLFWKTEYRFDFYRADDLPILLARNGAPIGAVEHAQKFVQTVTSSLVWKFNWGGPVVARY